MFTPEKLLAIAAESEAKYKNLLARFPPGTINSERNEARKRADEALVCAEWMENQKISALNFVGPFAVRLLARGQKVKIKAGSIVHSTRPKSERGGRALKRAQTIKIHSLDHGGCFGGPYSYTSRDESEPVVNPKVHWAGSGGYWCWTDANNILEFGPLP